MESTRREQQLSEHQANAKGEEHDAHIQELQVMNTELHQEMSRKDQDSLGQQVHQFEVRVKELREQDSAETTAHLRHEPIERATHSSGQQKTVSSDLTAARGLELLKSELSRRDASVRKLQQDLLLSYRARDTQSAQLDLQEQKLWDLRRELQESRQELQQGHVRLQQLRRELQDTTRQAQDLQAQLCEARGRLVHVQGNTEALLGFKHLKTAEVERLSAELCCLRGSEEEVQEGVSGVSVTQGQPSRQRDGAHDAHKRAVEQIQQLQEEVTDLKEELRCVSQQLQERTTELCSLQTSQHELQVQESERQRENASLRQQLQQAREELHSATLRAEEQRLRDVQIDELQREVDRTLALLEKDREDGGQVEELECLRLEQDKLKDKVSEGEARVLQLEKELQQTRQERAERHEGESQRLQETVDALRAALAEREKMLTALSLEVESLRENQRTCDQEVADLRRQLIACKDALQQTTVELTSCQGDLREQESQRAGQEQTMSELQAELTQLQRQYTTCYAQLVEEETSVSRLRSELQQVRSQRERLASQVQEQSSKTQRQQAQLTENHVTVTAIAQQEVPVSSREETLLRLTTELRSAQERLSATQEELSRQVQEVRCKGQEAEVLQQEMRGVQQLLRQKEEELKVEKHRNTQLCLEKDGLLTQCESQRVSLHRLRGEVERWQQETRDQRENREEEVRQLKEELQEAQSRLLQQRSRLERLGRELETAHRQQREEEEEALQREAALHAQEAELTRVKASLLEARAQASEADARLQPLSESLELCRHKYQACVGKLAQLEATLHSQEGALKEAKAQASDRSEQALRLQAEVVALQTDIQSRQAQLRSGDEALAVLTQRLEDTRDERDVSRAHARECELVIGALRDNTAALRRQLEEQEEAVVTVQSDFSVYRATHNHSDSEYQSQLSHIQELEQALSQAQERCGQGARELSACQAELGRLKEEAYRQEEVKGNSLSEIYKLQELVKQLQAEALCEARSRQAEVSTLEHRAAGLEEQLETAHRQCGQKDKAVQKRDALLRRSEADLVRARDELRGQAAEAESQADVVRALEAELRRARKETRRRESARAALGAQLVQVQQELQETRATCRESALELARQAEKAERVQEQLAERVAEVLRSEQSQRRLQAELQNLQHRLHSTEQELHDCRDLLEQAHLGAQQDTSRLLQENRVLQEELASGKESLGRLQEQLKDQTEAAQTLRADLAQEKLIWEQSAHNREDWRSLETERDQLKTDLKTAKNQLSERERLVTDLQERMSGLKSATLRLQVEAADGQAQLQWYKRELENRDAHVQELRHEARTLEGHSAELQAQLAHAQLWGQQQQASLQGSEEEVLLLQVELASVRESYHSVVARVEAWQAQTDSAEQRLEAAAAEAEELRDALTEARSDTSRLHHESELVVTNVNQWVKEQKQTHEKLGLKIKEQSKRIVHLTAENNHLQECVETLQGQIRRLQAEADERRLDTERCKNFPVRKAADEWSGAAQPHERLPAALPSLTSTVYSHPRESPRTASSLLVSLQEDPCVGQRPLPR